MDNNSEKNLKEKVIASFDDISRFEASNAKKWNHNNHYYKKMLDMLKTSEVNILDIGCGSGDFIKVAANYNFYSTGIDFSAEMINSAKININNIKEKCDFICGDAYDIIPALQDNYFDAAFSFAAMHHMDYLKLVPILKSKIKKGGFFGIVDIYESNSPLDYFVGCFAVPASIIMKKIRNGKTMPNDEERKIWDEHGKLDVYMTFEQIRAQMRELGVNYKLKHLLYFRYLLIIYF